LYLIRQAAAKAALSGQELAQTYRQAHQVWCGDHPTAAPASERAFPHETALVLEMFDAFT
jgi:hypothetical protein